MLPTTPPMRTDSESNRDRDSQMFGAPTEIRTQTERFLKPLPLPNWDTGAFVWCCIRESNPDHLPFERSMSTSCINAAYLEAGKGIELSPATNQWNCFLNSFFAMKSTRHKFTGSLLGNCTPAGLMHHSECVPAALPHAGASFLSSATRSSW